MNYTPPILHRVMCRLIQLVFWLTFLSNTNYLHAQAWTQLGQSILGDSIEDSFGYSVDLSDDGQIVAIGAHHNDAGGEDAGQVKVFAWDGADWVQRGIDLIGQAAGDRFGNSVALSADGNTLAVGAIFNDVTGTAAGQVQVYSWNGSTWIQKGSDLNAEAGGDQFGRDVDLSADGNVVAGSADFNHGNGINQGHVRVFAWNGSDWIQRGSDIDGEYDYNYAGANIDLNASGDAVAFGSGNNDDNGHNAGHARVFSWNGSAWVQKGNDIDGEAAEDISGRAVALDLHGNTIAIGATKNDAGGTDAGHIRVFSWNGSSWVQKGNSINGEKAGDNFGFSVRLSDAGNTLIGGGIYNADSGTNAGQVRVFSWNGSAWTQFGMDVNGEAAEDRFGISVALSADGNTWAAGARNNSTSAFEAGQVRIYSLATGIGEENFVPAFRAHPNPTTGLFTIDLDQTYSEITLSISNLVGQLLFTRSFQGVDKIDARLTGSSGFYLVNVVTPEGKGATLKVLKE